MSEREKDGMKGSTLRTEGNSCLPPPLPAPQASLEETTAWLAITWWLVSRGTQCLPRASDCFNMSSLWGKKAKVFHSF